MSAPNLIISNRSRKGSRLWLLLLALPYLGLCFPQLYARTKPVLWGFPFFYWYQFAWVLVTSVLLGVVYKVFSKTSD